MRRSISGTIRVPSRSLPSMDKTVFYRQFSSPLGKLLLTCDGQSLTGLFMTRLADGSAPEVTSGWNPISIIVPCHRVIGADGGLGGYGGGLDRKRWLLAHEAEVLARHPQWRSAPFPGRITPNLLAV